MSAVEYIAGTTLTATAATVTFSGIPGNYTDLRLIHSGSNVANGTIRFRVNGDSGTTYSWTDLYGNGASALNARSSNDTSFYLASISTFNTVSTADFLSYSNANVFKTVLVINCRPDAFLQVFSELWRSTSAITSIEVFVNSGGSMNLGSTLSLWGVK